MTNRCGDDLELPLPSVFWHPLPFPRLNKHILICVHKHTHTHKHTHRERETERERERENLTLRTKEVCPKNHVQKILPSRLRESCRREQRGIEPEGMVDTKQVSPS